MKPIKTPQLVKEALNRPIKSSYNPQIKRVAYVMTRINGLKTSEHRHVWEKHNGPVPEGSVVHHINQNKRDNRIENLQMMTFQEHMTLHKQLRKSYSA